MSFFNNAVEVLEFDAFSPKAKNSTSSIKPTEPIVQPVVVPTEKPEVPLVPPAQPDPNQPVVPDPNNPPFKVEETSKDDLNLIMDGLTFNEGPPKEEPVVTNPLVDMINHIGETLFEGQMESYDGFDPEEEPTLEIAANLISHNIEIQKEKAIEEFYESFNPLTQRIVSYDIESKGTEVDQYIRTLAEESTIKALNVENEMDQDRILRTWYQKDGWTTTEIDEKISELKTAGLLAREAGRIKPKLDAAAEEIAKGKEEEQRRARDIETQYRNTYIDRVGKTLSKNKIGSIQLSPEEAKELATMMLDDNTQIPLPNGKQITMPYLEALITAHRYSSKMSIENLALATLLLSKPDVFEQKYLRMIETRVTNEHVKDVKYNNSIKAGQIQVVESKKQEPVKKGPWKLKLQNT